MYRKRKNSENLEPKTIYLRVKEFKEWLFREKFPNCRITTPCGSQGDPNPNPTCTCNKENCRLQNTYIFDKLVKNFEEDLNKESFPNCNVTLHPGSGKSMGSRNSYETCSCGSESNCILNK